MLSNFALNGTLRSDDLSDNKSAEVLANSQKSKVNPKSMVIDRSEAYGSPYNNWKYLVKKNRYTPNYDKELTRSRANWRPRLPSPNEHRFDGPVKLPNINHIAQISFDKDLPREKG